MTNETYATLYTKIRTLNKQWFYDKTEIDTALAGYIEKSNTAGFVKNDGTIDTRSFALSDHTHTGTYANASHSHAISDVTGLQNALDGKSGTDHTHATYLPITQTGNESKNVVVGANGNITFEDKPTIPTVPTTVSSFTNDAGYLVANDIAGKANSGDLATVATSGSYNDLTNKPDIPDAVSDLTNDLGFLTAHQSLSDIGGEVTVEKQQSAESGYAHTYVIKQDGTQVGEKINIPKDFLVKSGTVATVSTANNPVQGYVVGDKYIDFVVNAKDNSATDEHIYILVSDLIDTPVAISDVTGLQEALNSQSSSTHTHGNITTDGEITQTVTNGGNIVVTNSSNEVGVQSALDVIGDIIDELIDYGTPASP